MEKLTFTVSQALAVMQLLRLRNSSFYKRVLGRYALIRIKDFIALARIINNKSQTSSRKQKKLTREQLNALSELYEEFLQKQRDKFSGHMQDLDLLERHNLWLDIDLNRLDFFASELLVAYSLFGREPGYVTDINNVDFVGADQAEIETVGRLFDIEDGPRMASDIFALTRFNTGGLVPTTAPQVKISVLAGLELLIDYEAKLMATASGKWVKNIARSLLLIDVISYLDNLYTRPVAPGAPQEMDGLDSVLKQDGRYADADKLLSTFRHEFDLESAFAPYRNIRNKVAAHLDESENLSGLISQLETTDYEKVLEHYRKLQSVLKAVCQAEFTLQHLMIPVSRMQGVIGMSMQPDRAFDQDSIPQVTFQQDPARFSSVEEYKRILDDFFSDKINVEDARSFYYQAFAQSREERTISLRGREIVLRKAHTYICDWLQSNNSEGNVIKCLQIINQCKNGYPDQLEYILSSTFINHSGSFLVRLNYIFQFGEIVRGDSEAIIDILKSESEKANFYSIYHALLALMKIEVRNNGIRYLNSRTEACETNILTFLFDRIGKMGKFHQMVVSVLLLSELHFNMLLTSFTQKYELLLVKRLRAIVSNIIENSEDLLAIELGKEDRRILLLAFDKNIFTTIFLLLGDRIDEPHENLRKFLFQLVVDGTMKLDFRNEVFVEHLGYVYFKVGMFAEAESAYRVLIDRNPDKPETYLALLELFVETKNVAGYHKARQELFGYVLNHDLGMKLSEMDLQIEHLG